MAAPAPIPACPRCGYDQSGAIAAWERNEPASCPLRGTCSECGLEFAWADVLKEIDAASIGIVEHVTRDRVRAFVRMLRRALWPPGFWRWFRMEYRIRPRRVLVWAALGAVAMHITAGVLCHTWDLARSWSGLAVPYTLPGRPAPAVPAADRLRDWYLRVRPLWQCLGPSDYGYWRTSPHVALGLVSIGLMPLTFLFLPITFRRLHVRRLHLLRIAAYGWTWVPVVLWLGMAIATPTRIGPWWSPRPFSPRAFEVTWRYVGGALVAWQIWWWWSAARYYLKLPRPLMISLVLTSLSSVAAFVILFAWLGGGSLLYGL